MEKNCFVRVATSVKTGKRFIALVVSFGEGREKMFFARPYDYCDLLNLSPSALAELSNGDYPIA